MVANPVRDVGPRAAVFLCAVLSTLLPLICTSCGRQAQAPEAIASVAELDGEKGADLTNPDIGLNPDVPLNFNADRVEGVAVPGGVDPKQAGGIASGAPTTNVPSPPGLGGGIGGSIESSISGKGIAGLSPGGMGGIAALPGGFAGRSGATREKMVVLGANGGHYDEPSNTEAYDRIVETAFRSPTQDPLSTFSVDVDTASYANVRRYLTDNRRPPKDAVRIEELVNYFPYDYAPPRDDTPFATHIEVNGCPWNPEHRLVRIGLKGREIADEQRPPCNLVFLLDVSGSMAPPNRLPLVKRGLRLLIERLTEKDRVAMVVYAGASGLVLPSTPGSEQQAILTALDQLGAGGSTNGGAGIELAYNVAAEHFIKGGSNRVVLCTDGDFNVGVTDQGSLTRLIEEKAKTGVFLSVLGFGMGNYKDSTLEKFADKGNGNYAFVDTLGEARKVLVEQMTGTLITIAKDVKIQVEFNPAQVAAYRLVGYENRVLNKEDFNDDKKDAGDIGAGHTVTALYEIVPAGKKVNVPGVDPLKYQTPTPAKGATPSKELLTVKLRYKQPDGNSSKLIATPVTDAGATLERASAEFRFAASVAAFALLLRASQFKGNATFASVAELAADARGRDVLGYRAEFLRLVEKAGSLRQAE